MSDYTRPSTWRPYKRDFCQVCSGECCRLPVEIHITELVTMGLAFEDEILHDLKNLLKNLKKKRIYRLYDQKIQMLTLEQKSDSSCIFLNKNKLCDIYEKRPQTCRNFPKIGPRPHFCPFKKKEK